MKTLVITSSYRGEVYDSVFNTLTAACQITPQCDVLVIGPADLTQLKRCANVKHIWHWEVSHENNLATKLAQAVAQLASGYSHVLTAADSYGKDLLPRVAGILDLSQISEVMAIVSPNCFKRPMYAGNVIAEIESFEAIKLLTIRPTCFSACQPSVDSAAIENLNLELAASSITLHSEEIGQSKLMDLTHAKVVVSGGHALGSADNFHGLIHSLAAKLKAAVGASRAAVEAGFAPNDCQVGQTGKIVAPQLYLAVGISGAVQHIAGMKGAKTVVAINIDPNAQIFEYADYGLVGDLFEIVPALIDQL
jgi:electron transfer flavoprotein alpha subunit